MSRLACVTDGDGGLWVASLGAPRTVAARSVLCARVDADGACRGQTAWSLPSAPLALAAAALAGAPHALALTADAHAWLLPLLPLPAAVAGAKRAAEHGMGEGPASAHAVTSETHAQRVSAPVGTSSCAWHCVAGDSGVDARDAEAPARSAWPLALVPGACVAAAAGDVALICRTGASPLALRLPARLPLPGELALLPAPAEDDDNDAWAPSCAALLARAGCTDDDCVMRGWPTLSPALCAALQLPRAGLRRGRAQLSACGCMRWALEGDACGTVRAHSLSDAEASAEAPAVADPGALHTLRVRTAPRALFHLHQRVIALLPAPSGQALVLVGARGRVVAALPSDAHTSVTLQCREWRAPCNRVDGAALLPDDALALLCDGGAATLVSSPLAGGTPAELSWRRVLDADAQPSRGIAAASADAARPLLLLRADGDVVAAALEQAGPYVSPAADDGDEAAHISEALRALAACDAAREELHPRAARADADVAALSAALPAAAVLTAAAVQARPAAAPLRCVLSDVVDDAYGDDEQFSIRLDVLNDTPRALSALWSVLAVARCGERSAFASVPLRTGVPAGSSVRVALPFPADLRPGAVCVDAWLVFDSPSAVAGPACFPAGAAVRDVLHMATPCGDSEAGMAPPPAMHPAPPSMTLRLRVPPACVTARDVLARVAGAACVAPARDGAGARAVASLPRGTTLRASAARAGVAELALAAPQTPTASRAAAILPLAQEALLRRALRQTPAPAADAGIDDDALTALRALRSRLIACQDSLDAVMRMRAHADAPGCEAQPALHTTAAAAAAELCAVYAALRGAPFNAHAAC